MGKKFSVFNGYREKTSGCLVKHGKVVSAQGKKANKRVEAWSEAFQKAGKELGIKGFVASS